MTLLWMAKTMYPDLFADIDLEQQVKDYYQEIYGVELSDEDVSAMFTPSSAAAEGFKKVKHAQRNCKDPPLDGRAAHRLGRPRFGGDRYWGGFRCRSPRPSPPCFLAPFPKSK